MPANRPVLVVAPDSFKGSLTAVEAAQAMADGLARARPDARVIQRPLADGGEGTLDCLHQALGGELDTPGVRGPDGEPAHILYLPGGQAVLECASVVGLPASTGTPVMQRSTRALGELMLTALDRGARSLIIGLGGSATNDGGAGLLAALGARFLDDGGKTFEPRPDNLGSLTRVDFGGLDPRLADTAITVLSDVDNPLCGDEGATATYGSQKGLTPEQVSAVDADLAHFARLAREATGKDVSERPGTGAAGGLGYALALLDAELTSGAERILQLIDFDSDLAGADWVITGEGKSDAQTLHGKLPMVVARHARVLNARAALLSGTIDEAARGRLEAAFDRVAACEPGPLDAEAARTRLLEAARRLAEGILTA